MELAYIFAVKGTFIQFLHRLDIFDTDGADGLFPWNTEVILLSLCYKYSNIQQQWDVTAYTLVP